MRPQNVSAADLGLIGVAARVIDRAHEIDQRPGAVEGAAHDLHDHRVVAEFEQAMLLGIGRAGAQCLDAARDGEPGLREQSIEREIRRRRGFARQPDPARDLGRQDGGVNGGRDCVDQPQAVETNQPLRRRIGQIVAPRRFAEAEQAVAGDAPLRLDGVGEACEIGRLAPERRRGDETAQPLAAPDQPFVDQHLDGAADGEAAHPEALDERRLAVDTLARPLGRDIAAQRVDELQVERPIQFRVQRKAHVPSTTSG